MEFPGWVPKWVRDEFQAEFARPDYGAAFYNADDALEEKEQIVQVLQSPDTAIVWETLGRYPEREGKLCELSACVWSGIWGFGHVAIKQSEKIRIAKETRKHANAITACLDRLTVQDGCVMNSIIHRDFVRPFIEARLSDELAMFHGILNVHGTAEFVPVETMMRSNPAIKQVAANFVGNVSFYSISDLLGGLCDSLDSLASRDRAITKPEHENAKRLYFLRNMTDNFMRYYGKPMRKETLAIASVFFDCSGLDEAAISRVAPVRKFKKVSQ